MLGRLIDGHRRDAAHGGAFEGRPPGPCHQATGPVPPPHPGAERPAADPGA
jgi:hypothetical protein